MSNTINLKSLTIPNGASVSNVLDTNSQYSGLSEYIGIQSPAALDAGTFTIEVSQDNATFATLCQADGTTALQLPAAAKARAYQFELAPWRYIRIKSSIAVAADRVFLITGNEEC